LTETLNIADKVIFAGAIPYEKIPDMINALDICIIPDSNEYRSPIKMFEYMAGKTPIVASDLPSIREILNEGNAVLVEPDNSKKLAEGISRILNNNELGVKISEQSFFDVQNYTWRERSEQVIDFIK